MGAVINLKHELRLLRAFKYAHVVTTHADRPALRMGDAGTASRRLGCHSEEVALEELAELDGSGLPGVRAAAVSWRAFGQPRHADGTVST